jgi:predicted short-subunit dehydrogenase-like oxidoreductase (DUF2520 family)
MKIVLIGAGNLATHLGKALKTAGHDISQVYSKTMASATLLAETIGCRATDDLTSLDDNADAYIVSVKDSALTQVCATACKNRGKGVFMHTAGSMPMEVFKGLAPHYGVFYPMQTFSKAADVDFSVIPTFIEYNDAFAEQTIKALAASITRHTYPLSSADRKYLHLSAVWACNFVNHCYDISSKILSAHNIPFEVMLPLIKETARKVEQMPPHKAQTGPAVRYDENVIHGQVQLMDDSPTWQRLYELMSESIHVAHNGQ